MDASTPPDDGSVSPSNDPFEELFRQVYPDLRSYGRRLTTRTAVVEDAIQEVFMALWRSDTAVGDLTHPRSYLLSALRRQILGHLQTERKLHTRHDDHAKETPAFIGTYEDLIVAHERRSEQHTKVKAALSTLSERRHEALYLRFRHGLTHQEVADVMDIAHQTARNYVSEALLHIRQHIKAVDAS
ncbi:hypothetical protein CRI93_14140 [Longimonas halophila]|uniref:RNA polymerase subunit sigma-24 n=1 Tax=Longimonas halophila TaxID=1469170 RepID=A0A2H3NHY4_9BACT|nr:sigma-70 family RNA polymerase sigma factor [Longimonas halophila]PEN04997.1 hypothetical protein CRI93_14140 [Longimonas halophila]